jgi:hypothetical protein
VIAARKQVRHRERRKKVFVCSVEAGCASLLSPVGFSPELTQNKVCLFVCLQDQQARLGRLQQLYQSRRDRWIDRLERIHKHSEGEDFEITTEFWEPDGSTDADRWTGL